MKEVIHGGSGAWRPPYNEWSFTGYSNDIQIFGLKIYNQSMAEK